MCGFSPSGDLLDLGQVMVSVPSPCRIYLHMRSGGGYDPLHQHTDWQVQGFHPDTDSQAVIAQPVHVCASLHKYADHHLTSVTCAQTELALLCRNHRAQWWTSRYPVQTPIRLCGDRCWAQGLLGHCVTTAAAEGHFVAAAPPCTKHRPCWWVMDLLEPSSSPAVTGSSSRDWETQQTWWWHVVPSSAISMLVIWKKTQRSANEAKDVGDVRPFDVITTLKIFFV